MTSTTALLARAGIGLLCCVAIAAAVTSCVYEPEAPPKPRSWFEGTRAPEPAPHLARVRSQCVPVFTEEEVQKLFEKCDRDGGRTRRERSVISCFQRTSAWYDDAIWIRYAEDYPRAELHEPLPSWVTTEGYRLVKE